MMEDKIKCIEELVALKAELDNKDKYKEDIPSYYMLNLEFNARLSQYMLTYGEIPFYSQLKRRL